MAREQKPLDFYAWHASVYASKTTHLSREADYAYRRILDHIFIHDQERCRVVDDEATLIAIARCTTDEWPAIRRALIDGPAALLRKQRGYIYSDRLVEEIEKAKDKSEKRSLAAKGIRSTNVEQLSEDCSQSASMSLSNSSSQSQVEGLEEAGEFNAREAFDRFWAECLKRRTPKPVHKPMAEKRFRKTVRGAEDFERLLRARDRYGQSERVRRGFVQDASTWLGDWESWEKFDDGNGNSGNRNSGTTGNGRSTSRGESTPPRETREPIPFTGRTPKL
jgi:uncharacterized protein YdaU (DUF1376 family)